MPFEISRAPYKVKMPRRAISKITLYNRSQLQAKAKDECGHLLDLLPPYHHQLWINFNHDGRKGQKQMYIGDIMNKSGKTKDCSKLEDSERTHVFVNLSARGTVRFRCADGKLEDHVVRRSLQLKSPFELVPRPALNSLIIYYFIMAGQYPHFVHVPDNLAGLKLACQAVEQATAKPSKSKKAAKKTKQRKNLYREGMKMLGVEEEGFGDSPKEMAMQQENKAEMKKMMKMFTKLLED